MALFRLPNLARCRLARSSCGPGLAGQSRAQDPRARCAAARFGGWAPPTSNPGPGGALASQEVSRELGFWVRKEEGEDQSPAPSVWLHPAQ